MNGAVRLVAWREVRSRMQQRGFRIGFGVVLLIVLLGVIVPSFFGGGSGHASYDVGVTRQTRDLRSMLPSSGPTTVTVHVAAAGRARSEVADGHWDAALLPGGTLVVHDTGSGVVPLLQQAYRDLTLARALRDDGLTRTQVAQALRAHPLTVRGVGSSSGEHAQRQAIAIIAVVVLFTQLATFCTWVATGVVEEKASRVVELILASIRPLQLLAGKLLGIGTLAAAQVLSIGVVALAAGTAVGTISLPVSALATVATAFVGFVLGFAFFGALAAALASTVSRQEEVSGVIAPVTLSLTVCYLAAFATAGSPDGVAARVLSIVPPVSAIAMPSRIAGGGVPVFDVVLAVVLLVAAAAGVTALAARIYRASVLHSGSRVSLLRAWRGEATG